MRRRLLVCVVVGVAFAAAPPTLSASPLTFVGKDTGVNYGGPFPNSDTANASLKAAITAAGQTPTTLDFESAPLGPFASLIVGSGVTATFANQDLLTSGISNQNPSGLATFDTTRPGTKYVNFQTMVATPAKPTTTATLTFMFATPIDTFGAYLVGLGNDAPFNYQFNDGTGTLTISASGINNGYNETQFFGFTDFSHSISSVALNLEAVLPSGTNQWYYAVGVDDVTYSSSPVPEPATLFLLGSGLLAAGLRRRKTQA